VLASGAATEIARTDFVRLRRGRLYIAEGELEAAELEQKLAEAFGRSDDGQILSVTARILAHDQADIRSHVMRAVALRRTGRAPEADFHRGMAIALIESIVRGGDGRGFATAWTVFRTKEEYAVLRARGYDVEKQSLADHDGRVFDVLRARETKGGEAFDAYFDVTEMYAEEGRALGARPR
jgi:hypothetical protein